MAATDLRAGLAIFNVGGKVVQAEGAFSVDPSTEMREAKVSLQGRVFTKRTKKPGTLTATILITEEITPEWAASIDNVEAEVRINGGRSYAITGLTSNGAFAHDVVEGTFPLECYFQSCTTDDG